MKALPWGAIHVFPCRYTEPYLPLELPEGPAAATSIQKNSGLPQGPADLSPGRLLMRQTACAPAVLAGKISARHLGGSPHARHEAARVHHAARWRGGRVAARGARAAADDAGDRLPRD